MKAIAITATAREHFSDLIDGMHRLCASVFKGRLRWGVEMVEGREVADFDQLPATNILLLSGSSEGSGCARALPATGKTMLERAFTQLLTSRKLDTHAAMIESSRFCVDTTVEEGGGEGSLHEAAPTSEIVTATDVRFERILKQPDWPMTRLGEPMRIGNAIAVAGSMPADRASLERVPPASSRCTFTPLHNAA